MSEVNTRKLTAANMDGLLERPSSKFEKKDSRLLKNKNVIMRTDATIKNCSPIFFNVFI
jgi:hypothetical protein